MKEPDPKKYPDEGSKIAIGILDDLFKRADLDLNLIPSEVKKESYFVVKQKRVEPKIGPPR